MQIQLCLLLTNQVQTYDYDYLFARSAANQPNLKTPDYTYLPLGAAVVYRLCTSLLISCGPQQVLKSWIADRVDRGSRGSWIADRVCGPHNLCGLHNSMALENP